MKRLIEIDESLYNRVKERVVALDDIPCVCKAVAVSEPYEQTPQGIWVTDSDGLPICQKCGEVALQRVFVKMPHLIQDIHMVRSNFCPNCGVKMENANNG